MGNRTCTFLALLILAANIAVTSEGINLVVPVDKWPPYRIMKSAEPPEFEGFDIDVLRELEKRLGLTVTFDHHPWSRSLEMLREGQGDLMTGIAWTPERATYLEYVPTPYTFVQPVIYARKGEGSAIRNYADLAGKAIGETINTAYFEPYNSDTALNKKGFTGQAQVLQILALGRLDLAIGTDPNISWYILQSGLAGKFERTAYAPPGKTELFIALSKKSGAARLAPLIDQALRDMHADGTLEKIAAKYR